MVYGVLGLIKEEYPKLVIDYTCRVEELVFSLLECYTEYDPLHYYKMLTDRLQVDREECFAYAKKIVKRDILGDAGKLLALQNLSFQSTYTRLILTHVDEQTLHPTRDPSWQGN